MKEHFEKAPQNAKYNSKTIQNELICVTGEWITQTIVSEIKKARFFTVLADETADISNTEQMSIVLRYVDNECNIKEDFIQFTSCRTGISGEALSTNIISILQKLGLDINLLRGQGYDGAGNMAGCRSGVAARIQALVPLAVYVHCFSHKLNLAIVGACDIITIRNAMGVISQVAKFFDNSPNRQEALRKKSMEEVQSSKKNHLLDLCRTRWVYRHTALEHFNDLYEVVVDVLNEMKHSKGGWNRDTITDASSLIAAITKFDFVMDSGKVLHW